MLYIYKLAILATVTALLSTTVFAQTNSAISANDIVNALQSGKPQATRSITATQSTGDSLTSENREFLHNIKTRGLRIETVTKIGEIIEGSDLPSLDIEIIFGFDSASISIESMDDLATLASALHDKSLLGSRILLNGHTDAKGQDSYNLSLSQKRADAVRLHLITEHNISENRLLAVGFGEQRLKNKSEPEAAMNRRVEVVNIGNLK